MPPELFISVKAATVGVDPVKVIRLPADPETFQLVFIVIVLEPFTVMVCAAVPVSVKLLQVRLPAITIPPVLAPRLNQILFNSAVLPAGVTVIVPDPLSVNIKVDVPALNVNPVGERLNPKDEPVIVQVVLPILIVRVAEPVELKFPAVILKLLVEKVP